MWRGHVSVVTGFTLANKLFGLLCFCPIQDVICESEVCCNRGRSAGSGLLSPCPRGPLEPPKE